MGYEEFVKNQKKLDKTQIIWTQITKNPEKFKNTVENKSKIIFYEDLFKQLPQETRNYIETPEDLKQSLKIYFKCENISYNFIRSYEDFVIKKFENGYLWNKITTEVKYDKCFKEVEFIDKEAEHKSVAINYTRMFDNLKQSYPKYIKNKRDMKRILSTYFEKNSMNYSFISNEEEYENYSKSIVKKLYNK